MPLRPEVLHLSELLAPHAASLPVAAERRLATASYQDPCHLGRRLGCYEPPRQLLRRAVVELRELPTHHGAPEARCCGAGGLLPTTDSKLAQAIAAERLAELPDDNGPLITACPACENHLSKSGTAQVRGLIDILDEVTTPA